MTELRKMLRCKIHRATVTQADLNYEGSITIPPDLLEVAKLLEFEAVEVWNVTNGARFETYSIAGKPDSRDICLNGAAARLVSPGDLVIIAAFSYFDSQTAHSHLPINVFVDENNRVTRIGPEKPGPQVRC